jgi:hypothetical protein
MGAAAPPLEVDGGASGAAAAPAAPQGSQAWKAWQGTVFTNAKAGMGKVDAAKVKQVVYEMSKDSPHFRNEERKQARCEACRCAPHRTACPA